MATTTIDLTGRANLKDLSATQIQEYVRKKFDVVNKADSFWTQFADSANLENEKGTGSWTTHRQVITENTRNQVLKEGALAVNLTPDKLRVVAFTVTTQSYYRYLPLTSKLLKKSFNDTMRMASNQMADGNLRDREALVASMMVSGGVTQTYSSGTSLKALFSTMRARLKKNGAKPIDGFFNCVTSIEGKQLITDAAGDEFENEKKNDIVLHGTVGYWEGFRIIEAPANDEYIYPAAESGNPTATYMLFFGKGMLGLPVVKTNVGGSGDAKVYYIGPKHTQEDPLAQRACLASEVDDVGIYMQHDECLIRVEVPITFVESDIGNTQAEIEAFYLANASRNGFQSAKSEGTPNASRQNETMEVNG